MRLELRHITTLAGVLALAAGAAGGASAGDFAHIGHARAAAPQAAPAGISQLDVQNTEGQIIADGVGMRVKGTYSCQDQTGPHQVTITALVNQGNGNGGHAASQNVPCQVTDGAFDIDVPDPGIQPGQEANVTTQIDDGSARALNATDALANRDFLNVDPTGRLNGDGTTTVTGNYLCDGGGTGVANLNMQQADGAVAGAGKVSETCDGITHTFSAVITKLPASSTADSAAAGQRGRRPDDDDIQGNDDRSPTNQNSEVLDKLQIL